MKGAMKQSFLEVFQLLFRFFYTLRAVQQNLDHPGSARKHRQGKRSFAPASVAPLTMNKLSSAASLSLLFALGLLLAAPQAAHASADTGTVHFTGEIRANTCTLVSKNVQVDFGDWYASDFTHKGELAFAQPFTLALTGCSPELQGVSVKFEGRPDAANPDYLAVGTGQDTDAKGLAVELFDNVGMTPKEIPINSKTAEHPLHAGDNTLHFSAGYVSTADKVKAGNANAVAEFTLQYR